jgi:hypothetical protein
VDTATGKIGCVLSSGTSCAPGGGSLDNIVTAGTNTKITYNAKGRVTAGASLSAGDIPDLSATYQPKFGSQTANFVYAAPNGSAGVPAFRALVPADYPVFLASGVSHAAGAVPDPGASAGTTKYLREDASWQQIAYSQLSGVPTLAQTISNVAHKWLNSYNATTGLFTQTQPDFTDLTGSIASSQQNNPAVGAKGGVEAKTCTSTDKISAIGTDGIPVCSADQTSAGGSGYATIQNAAVSITQRAVLNWTADIFCSDNVGATRSDCSLDNIVTAGTNTKITYNAKGRVTAGAQAKTIDLADFNSSPCATNGQVPIWNTSTSKYDCSDPIVSGAQPAATAQNITATGAGTAVSVAGYGLALFTTRGTYAGFNANFEGSPDGTNWFPLQASRSDAAAIETSTGSLTNTTRSWLVSAFGMTQVRWNTQAYTSGTVNTTITPFYAPLSSWVNAQIVGSLPLPTGAAQDATLTGGTQKAIVRGGQKGATNTNADITHTAEGTDHEAVDVQLYHGGVAKDPTQIRALTNADVIKAQLQDNAGNGLASSTSAPAGTEQALITRNIPGGTQPVSQATAAAGTAGWPMIAGNLAAQTAAWTSATSLNTALTLTTTNYSTVAITFNGTSTLTAGQVTYEVDDGSGIWFPISPLRVFQSNSGATTPTFDNTYPISVANQAWHVNVAGFTGFRIRLSTVITGTGTANFRAQGSAGTNIPYAAVYGSTTALQGTKGTNGNAWWAQIGDGTNGPVAVKAAFGKDRHCVHAGFIAPSSVGTAVHHPQRVCVACNDSGNLRAGGDIYFERGLWQQPRFGLYLSL